ncbi:MAG: hypothetical protein HY040_13895 [Planctomycetes bacterium]|nr:hypothetical protein [Planctomycetota bacterium]
MPLFSQILKDDPALQACLVRDQAHVVPGVKGSHVAKIQKALLLLEQSNIQLIELQTKLYGPTTTEAVLAYKRKRRIINFSYQTTADNIVGKMTIARLDEDLLDMERRVTPDHSDCGGGSGGGSGGGASAAGPAAVGPAAVGPAAARPAAGLVARGPGVRLQNARLSILFQETAAAEELGGGFKLGVQLFARARELMAPHGIAFSDGLFLDFVGTRVPDFENVIPGSPASCFSVREAAERVAPGRAKTLRVIFCPFDEKGGAFGVTDGGTLPGSGLSFPKFCLINVRKANPDQGTLLHEMVHAAKVEKVEHDTDPRSVYSEEQSRTILPSKHAESLANAFFSTILL